MTSSRAVAYTYEALIVTVILAVATALTCMFIIEIMKPLRQQIEKTCTCTGTVTKRNTTILVTVCSLGIDKIRRVVLHVDDTVQSYSVDLVQGMCTTLRVCKIPRLVECCCGSVCTPITVPESES